MRFAAYFIFINYILTAEKREKNVAANYNVCDYVKKLSI